MLEILNEVHKRKVAKGKNDTSIQARAEKGKYCSKLCLPVGWCDQDIPKNAIVMVPEILLVLNWRNDAGDKSTSSN